jgi:hypothetical protein
MNVIGHDTPDQEQVSNAVKVEQGILDQFCNFITAEPTCAVSCVKVIFSSPPQFNGSFIRRTSLKLATPAFQYAAWQSVTQTEI